MNKRKMKKQITLGNTDLSKPIVWKNRQPYTFKNRNGVGLFYQHNQYPLVNNRRNRRIGITPKIKYTPFARLDNMKELLQ